MIRVHRLNGSELVINADLIETVEATPDTVITLTTGKKIVVLNPVDDVIRRAVNFKRSILAAPQRTSGAEVSGDDRIDLGSDGACEE